METYSLADLVSVTGAKRRSLQLWADAGVIEANKGTDRAGTGTHRVFSRQEAIIACIIHAFALRQVAIGELLFISKGVRRALANKAVVKYVEDSIRGATKTHLVYESWKDSRDTQHQRARIESSSTIDFPELENARDGLAHVISLHAYLRNLDTA